MQVTHVPEAEWPGVARFLAMTAPSRTGWQWLDWLTGQLANPLAVLLGVREQGQWVGAALLVREETSIAGRWLPVAETKVLAAHPGMRWIELTRALIAAATAWSGNHRAVLLRCEETPACALSTFGFVPQAPVTVVACRAGQLARQLQANPVRHAEAADMAGIAALYEARALATTGMERRSPALWQGLAGQLAPRTSLYLMVADGPDGIDGYVLFKKAGGTGDKPILQLLEWLDRGPESTRAIVRYLSLLDPLAAELRLPLWPDRPRSLILGTSGEWTATLRCGPSLVVLDAAALLAAHVPGEGLVIAIGDGPSGGVYAVADGRAEPTIQPADVTMSRRVLAQLVGGHTPLAEALGLDSIKGTPSACEALVAAWRPLPFYRMPHH